MPTTTAPTPRQQAAMKATRSRIAKARERRFAGYVAEMERAGYAVRITDLEHGTVKTFSPDPR